MNALEIRAAGARELIRLGEVAPAVALSYVVWPTEELESVSSLDRLVVAEAQRERALELVGEGWSWTTAAREVGLLEGDREASHPTPAPG